ncbi:hypothetical protein PQQ87_08355 [Paraburkholderia nemoris]|uniref:hypothetical protein n=1 Tax=Paraburkholderia nemoris TaxID=2793076 RepID=UPI0038B8E671
MKKLLIASLIALTANAAHAFSYANEAKKLEMCRAVAELGERGYQDRIDAQNQGLTDAYMPNRPDDESQASWIGGLLLFAYNYGHRQAADQRDAHMVAFGKCMDNVDHAAHRSPGNYMTEEEVSE